MRLCIVGTGRSGTTLLRELIGIHPDMFVFDETHWLPKMYEAYGEGPAPVGDLVSIVSRTTHVDGTPTLARFPEGFESRLTGAVTTVRDFCDALGASAAAAEGKRWWGDKTPDYGPYMATLQRLWPECRFIHVVRNGLDTAMSMAAHPGYRWLIAAGEYWWPWPSFNGYRRGHSAAEADPVAFLRLWATRLARIRDELSRLTPGSWIEVGFDRLLADPAGVLRELTGFVRIEAASDWMDAASRRVSPGRVVERGWPPGLPIPDDLHETLERNRLEI